MLLSLRDSVPAATVEALVEALYAQGQLSSPILPLAGNLMSLQSAREVQELRREVSKLWVALRSLALVGSAPSPTPPLPCGLLTKACRCSRGVRWLVALAGGSPRARLAGADE